MSLSTIALSLFPPPEYNWTAVGDLGCPGVDIEEFKRRCRAPLNPEGWNRWLLWRTTRDEPSAADVERMTHAVFGKWFELVEGPSGLSMPGKGTGKVDNLAVRIVPWDFVPKDFRSIARVEECPETVTIAGEATIGVLTDFVYRGTDRDMPWPVHKAQMLNSWCPLQADWALARVYEPSGEAVPRERTAVEELGSGLRAGAALFLPSPVTVVAIALVGLGVVLVARTLRP